MLFVISFFLIALNGMGIRKKLTEINAEDLEHFPIWEYSPHKDESGNCDYTVLKPRPDITVADPLERMLIISCKFTSASGKVYYGFCTPYRENDLGYIQPHIIYDNQLIPFWYGIYNPGSDELNNYYDILGEDSSSLFPIKYEALVEVTDAELRGEIPGFMRCGAIKGQIEIF